MTNAFSGVDVGSNAAVALVDIDNDGDLDAFIGESFGTIKYYQNTGSNSSPTFTSATGGSNPFNGVDVGLDSAPSFVDIDNDGDQDAFIGADDGTVYYYQNTGSASSPTFTSVTGASNPFNGVDVGIESKPAFVDIDNDGDQDAFIGEQDGTTNYFQNTGSASSAAFSEITGSSNPFNGLDIGGRSTPAFFDFDGDGDLDAFLGETQGDIHFYVNTGTNASPAYSASAGYTTNGNNPFNGVLINGNSTLAFVDIDNDGDKDLYVGNSSGTVEYFQNNGLASVNIFSSVTGSSNPLNGEDVGSNSNPALVDIDNDGDKDVFSGESGGTIKFYRNTGSSSSPSFSEITGASNPFNGEDVGSRSWVAFVDIDNDGDQDAFVGEQDGVINFYRNTGSASSPTFTSVTGASNPFNGVDVGTYSTPVFADLDNDGDQDALIGENGGGVFYYRNTGSASSPTFTQQTGANNPFNGVTVGDGSEIAPGLVDIDGDGDQDAFFGDTAGKITFFKNTGSASSPVFSLQAGNRLAFVDPGSDSTPAFADIDGDGDQDAFVGEASGNFNYYINSDTTPPLFISGYPQTANIAGTSLDITVQLEEPGTVYYVLVADGSTAPTTFYIKSGLDGGGGTPLASGSIAVTAASTSATGGVTGLSGSTAYDIYLVPQDDESTPNLLAFSYKLDATTTAAPPTESTAAAGLSGASVVAPGSEVQLLSVGITGAGSATLTSVALTISDLSAATGLAASDFTELRLYRSADAALGGDTQIGAQSTVNIGGATAISPTSTETPTNGSETFYIVSAVISSSAAGTSFRVGFATGGVTTSAATLGTAVTAADGNKVTLGSPTLSLSSALALGDVVWGTSGTGTLTVGNTGTSTLTISGVSASDSRFSVSPSSFAVAAGGSQAVTVTFTPTGVGGVSATLTVSSSDASVGSRTVSLGGTGADGAVTDFTITHAGQVKAGDGFRMTVGFLNAYGKAVSFTGVVKLADIDGHLTGSGEQELSSASSATYDLVTPIERTSDGSARTVTYSLTVGNLTARQGSFEIASRFDHPSLQAPKVEVWRDGAWVDFADQVFVGGERARLRVTSRSAVSARARLDISYPRLAGQALLYLFDERLEPGQSREFAMLLPYFLDTPTGEGPVELWAAAVEGPPVVLGDGERVAYRDAEMSQMAGFRATLPGLVAFQGVEVADADALDRLGGERAPVARESWDALAEIYGPDRLAFIWDGAGGGLIADGDSAKFDDGARSRAVSESWDELMELYESGPFASPLRPLDDSGERALIAFIWGEDRLAGAGLIADGDSAKFTNGAQTPGASELGKALSALYGQGALAVPPHGAEKALMIWGEDSSVSLRRGQVFGFGFLFGDEVVPRTSYTFDARAFNGAAGGHSFTADLDLALERLAGVERIPIDLHGAGGQKIKPMRITAEGPMEVEVPLKLGALALSTRISVATLPNEAPTVRALRAETRQVNYHNPVERMWVPVEDGVSASAPLRLVVEATDADGLAEVGVRVGGEVVARHPVSEGMTQTVVALEIPAAVRASWGGEVQLEPYAIDRRGLASEDGTDFILDFGRSVVGIEYVPFRDGHRVFPMPERPSARPQVAVGLDVRQTPAGGRVVLVDTIRVRTVFSDGTYGIPHNLRMSGSGLLRSEELEDGTRVIYPRGLWDKTLRAWTHWPSALTRPGDGPEALAYYVAPSGEVFQNLICPFVDEVLPMAGPEDFNGDGVVDAADARILKDAIEGGGSERLYDLNGDGAVDGGDYLALLDELPATVELPPDLVLPAGGFNWDGVVDAADARILREAIKEGRSERLYDLDGDGTVDGGDYLLLVESALADVELPADLVLLLGDLNLDGVVDAEDARLLREAVGEGSAGSLYDLNGDGAVDGSDYLVLLGELPPSIGSPLGESLQLGDFNLDGAVDAEDAQLLKGVIEEGEFNGYYNLDGDGAVDRLDYLYFVDVLLAGAESLPHLELMRGDFNWDLTLDMEDARLLRQAIAAGSLDRFYQLDGNDRLDAGDYLFFVSDLLPADVELPPDLALIGGDFNLDGAVDAADARFLRAAVAAGASLALYDIDGNDMVDARDFRLFVEVALAPQDVPDDLLMFEGDFNLDGTADLADARILRTAVAEGGVNGFYDLDGDGLVGAGDYAFFVDVLLADARVPPDMVFSRGDFNWDGVVDAADALLLRDEVGTGSINGFYDLDGLGTVDRSDFLLFVDEVLPADVELPPSLANDFDLDGIVDIADARFLREVIEGGESVMRYDFNGDGWLDWHDYLLYVDEALPGVELSPDLAYARGDLNWDGAVDTNDELLMRQAIEGGIFSGFYDLDRSGAIDRDDLLILVSLFGSRPPGKLAAPGPALDANYPNPFNATTAIPYRVGRLGPVRLAIYDALGRRVKVLVDQVQAPGRYRPTWDGTDGGGRPVAVGLYVSRLQTVDGVHTSKLLLVK